MENTPFKRQVIAVFDDGTVVNETVTGRQALRDQVERLLAMTHEQVMEDVTIIIRDER